ncbi:Ornithine cyclodeaminase [Arthrobacter sp. 9AX]|uniref:ornithine cyclodeaminase family protein n=1 Tax=Arthrobacter sp. 9AX TaxID=2653131 RepID=UPI0012EFC0B7|nr:ornithine cyclodeaminase family protein [Arthrobacter sp. 9AX]VXC51758.1 Ornithine cyclodeaminase [Arthrobacter sp. 9AX]
MTLFLTAEHIAALIGDVDVLAAVEAVHADLGSGAMTQPPPSTLAGEGDAVFLPMAARSDRLGLAAVKLMADIPGNGSRGLPTQRSTILVSSTVTGECVAVLDGALVTRLRTAAASAVATRYLARGDSRTLGLVGAGNLAIEHVRAISAVRPIENIIVWSRSAATTARFLEAVSPELRGRTVVAADPRAVVQNCDVLCTLTPSVDPIVRGSWLQPGQHVNAVGARPRPTHRELDGGAMGRGTLVVDSADTALSKSGDLLQAIAEGAVPGDVPLRELGHVVAGTAPARTGPDEITVFNSVGLAAQDLATAAALIDLARLRDIGTLAPLTAIPAAV